MDLQQLKKLKMRKNKYIYVLTLLVLSYACNEDNTLPEIVEEDTETVAFENNGDVDFSNYVAIGASFTAGFTDNALFINAQENSFPNIMAGIFSDIANGGDFTQPLMNDNIGGMLFGGALDPNGGFLPRLYFNGSGPAVLNATPTTEATSKLSGTFNNMGVPGAKSYHLVADGYGSLAAMSLGLANPYFVRFSSGETTSVLTDAITQQPTFFSLIDGGGNDVLGYALAGGGILNGQQAIDQTGNFDPSTYGTWDITDPNVFASVFSNIVTALTSSGAKGVISNVPYITSLAHFTTVPYNPLDPTEVDDDGELTDAATGLVEQVPTLNTVFGAVNQVFEAVGETNRIVEFTTTETNPVVIIDENLADLSATITTALANNPEFPAFVQQFGLPTEATPLVAGLLGTFYGQIRPATADDLLVLPSSGIIGTVNTDSVAYLMSQGLSQELAGQFSVEGLTKPLDDNWVLTPEEQETIKTATDAYNETIAAIASANENVVLVDFNGILTEAATTGLAFDTYTMTTDLVTGGLISLDGIHLTSRGYALMANKILEAIDNGFDTNFTEATNGLAKADDYPTNYSSTLE